LHAALKHVRHAELLADFAQIALRASFVLHDGGAADDLQIRDSGEVRQDFILHAVSEISVLFVVAQVLERQNCNRLLLI